MANSHYRTAASLQLPEDLGKVLLYGFFDFFVLLVMPLLTVGLLLTVVLWMVLLVCIMIGNQMWRHLGGSALQIDVHPPCVMFGGILKSLFTAHLLNPRLDLLDMVV